MVENLDGKRVPVKASDRATRQGQYPYYGASGVIDQVEDFLFDGDYLLIAEDGANLLSRSSPIAFQAHGRFWVNNHAHITRPLNGAPLAYLESFLNSIDLSQYVTGTAQPKLTQKALNRIDVPVAPINEQRRIIAKLEALKARSRRAREALDAVPPLIGKLRQSILAAAFRGELTKDWRAKNKDVEPAAKLLERIRAERRKKREEAELAKMKAKGKASTDDKWKAKYKEPEPVDAALLPDLPWGWAWVPLPLLGELARGKSKHRPRNDPALFGASKPFIQTGEVARSGGRISDYSTMYSEFGVAQSRVFPAGTVCITIAANIAATGILDFESCFPDSVVGFTADGDSDVARYVELFIRTARADLKRFAPATAQANINLETLSEVAVPVPPHAEMVLVAQLVGQLMDRAKTVDGAHDAVVAMLGSHERAVLAKAFRGELVPQDPNDEPAEAMLVRARGADGAATNGKSATVAKRGRRPGPRTEEVT